jgi:PAS domain S-box-containing protein
MLASAGDARARGSSEGPPDRSRSIYEVLVESVRDYAIFALDSEGNVATWNDGAHRLKGYEAHEITGRHFSVFYPAADVAAGKPDHELEVAAAEGRVENEGWRLRKDGSRFWANVVITPLRDDSGALTGYAKVTRDLTERRLAEERALMDARQLAEAEAASRAKSDFLAAMSHELRTPLNAIAGYVDVLSLGIRGPLTQEQSEDLERIRRSQRHLLGIVNDLINFSNIEAGRLAYHIRPLDTARLLDTARAMLEPQAATKGIEVEWPSPEALRDHAILGDEAKVEQILVNVIGNAVKFTDRGGRIVITCERDGDGVRIEVSDTGIGIPLERLDRIFEPFVQVGRSLTSPLEGSGLGLAISRDLTRAMGGSLTVRSRVDAGSTFTLVLPASP